MKNEQFLHLISPSLQLSGQNSATLSRDDVSKPDGCLAWEKDRKKEAAELATRLMTLIKDPDSAPFERQCFVTTQLSTSFGLLGAMVNNNLAMLDLCLGGRSIHSLDFR